MKISILIPVFNEKETIIPILNKVNSQKKIFDLIQENNEMRSKISSINHFITKLKNNYNKDMSGNDLVENLNSILTPKNNAFAYLSNKVYLNKMSLNKMSHNTISNN